MLNHSDSHSDAQADRQRRHQVAVVSQEIRRLARDRDRLEKPPLRHSVADIERLSAGPLRRGGRRAATQRRSPSMTSGLNEAKP